MMTDDEADPDGEGEFYLAEIKAIYAPDMHKDDWAIVCKKLMSLIGENNFITTKPSLLPDGETKVELLMLEGKAHFALTDLVDSKNKENKLNERK